MRGLWHLYLAARQTFANWQQQRHIDLLQAWRATAADAQRRLEG